MRGILKHHLESTDYGVRADPADGLLLAGEPQYAAPLARARAAFLQFWNPEAGSLYDTLGTDGEPDASLRPNALIALALPDTPAVPMQVGAALLIAGRELLTPTGLRTLAHSDPRYLGNYGGPQLVCDAAYHQGTVWPGRWARISSCCCVRAG